MKYLVFFALSIGLYCSSFAQEQTFKFDYTISSKAFGDDRQISVYLPPHYYEYPGDQYTVTYVLDGHFDPFIDLVVKTIEYNTYMYRYTPTIVVGIHAKERGWEFSMPEEGETYEGGMAPELRQHIANEVIPFVDSMYTNTWDFRSLIGHSSGGVFVLSTLFGETKDVFDAYVAISPALRPGEYFSLDSAAYFLKQGEQFRKFLYCSTGSFSDREVLFREGLNRFDSLFNVYPTHGLMYHNPMMGGMDHFSLVGPSVNDAMLKLTRSFRADELLITQFAKDTSISLTKQINDFYDRVEREYGFKEIPLPGYLSQIAFSWSNNEMEPQAMELYEWAILKHPDNFTLRKSKAKLYLKQGEKAKALQAFQKSLEVLESIKSKMSEEQYSEQKKYVEQKMEEARAL